MSFWSKMNGLADIDFAVIDRSHLSRTDQQAFYVP